MSDQSGTAAGKEEQIHSEMRSYDGILWQRVERQNEMISDIQADVRAHRERMDAQDSRINRIFDEMQSNRKEMMTGLEQINEKVSNVEAFLSRQEGADQAKTEAQNSADAWKRWFWPLLINILVLMTSMGLFTFTDQAKSSQEEAHSNVEHTSVIQELYTSRDPWEAVYSGEPILDPGEPLGE